MPDFHVLIPEATRNLITNPSFENGLSSWVRRDAEDWDQEATFENGFNQPLADTNPFAFDAVTPAWDKNAQFETEDLSEFDATVDAGGNLSVTAVAAHDGGFGLEIDNSGVANAYGTLDLGAAATSAVYGLWFNPNSIGIGAGVISFMLLHGAGGFNTNNIFVFIQDASPYDLDIVYTDDTSANNSLGIVSITDGWHFIILHWIAATAPGANDGVIRAFVYNADGTLVGSPSATNLDTDLMTATSSFSGRSFSSAAAPTGAFYMDSIYIDPVGAPFPLSIAAMDGSYGVAIPVSDTTNRNGSLNDPNDETRMTVEFKFNVNDLIMANADEFALMTAVGSGPAATFRVELLNNGGQLQLRYQYWTDAPALVNLVDVNINSNQIYKVRIVWAASSGANDGFIRAYLDDVFQNEASSIDNDLFDVDQIDSGAVTDLDVGTIGLFYMDTIRWANEILDVDLSLATMARVNTRARFGRFSAEIVTDGEVLNEGVYFRADTTNINELVTASAYVRGEGKLRIRIFDGLTGAESISKPLTINDNRWHRIEIRGRAVGGDDLRVYIETAETAQELIFYIDGVQLEEQEQATTYCDGEQQGCRWNGVSHASISERNAEEMSGGIWFPIREEGCSPDIYVTVISGFGVPPITLNRQRTASTPGSVFDSLKVEERTMQLIIWVKDEDVKKTRGLVLERLHELRQTLIDLVKPDISPNTEPFMLRYTDNGKSLTIRCRYNAGLEFDGDIRNKFTNTIPLRLLALDPYWEEDNQEVALLDTENDLGRNHPLLARRDGEWEVPFPDQVGRFSVYYDMAEDPNGRIYLTGYTEDAFGVPSVRYFGYTDDNFENIIEANGGIQHEALAVATHPNGMVYVGGTFLGDVAGNPFDRILEYNPATDTFAAMAGGVDDGAVADIFVASNGWIYIVGDFTIVNGAPANFIAYWDGGLWHTVGDIQAEIGGITNLLELVVVSQDEIYAVGDNTIDAMLFYWDGSDWFVLHTDTTTPDVSPGGSDTIIRREDGVIIYTSHKRDDSGAVFEWNGSAFSQIGEDFLDQGGAVTVFFQAIAIDLDGNILVAGRFDENGGNEFFRIAIWNGSVWHRFDINLNTGNILQDILVTRNGDIWFGTNTNDPPTEAAAITFIENISTTDVFPIFDVTGTGTILWLENQTTGQRIYLNYTIQADEILTLDFREGLRVTSNYRGSVPNAVLPNSDDFFLAAGKLNIPKENKISALMIDEVDPVIQLRYVPIHWSIDATAS